MEEASAGWLGAGFRFEAGAVADEGDGGLVAGSVTSFGEDVAGGLYMLVAEGSVFKIVAAQ